jgi:hypothetical protein
MAYAINIADLTKYRDDYVLMTVLLGPVLNRDPERIVWVGGAERVDEIGVRLECDEERAVAIVEIIRMRLKRYELRIYHSRTGKGGWKRV